MHLYILVPCLDEQHTLPCLLREIPPRIPGVDALSVVVVDDGSRDETVAVARRAGVRRVLPLHARRGLGRAVAAGMRAAVAEGADAVVVLDADGQYPPADLYRLVEPLGAGRAQLVVGDRNPGRVTHFSRSKRWLQRMGSGVVSRVAGVPVRDACSGFRAFSREAAQDLSLTGDYSHVLETLVLAGARGWRVIEVPVGCRPPRRPSRLYRSLPAYLFCSGWTLLGGLAVHRPGRVFLPLGLVGGGAVAVSVGALGTGHPLVGLAAGGTAVSCAGLAFALWWHRCSRGPREVRHGALAGV